MKKKERKRKKWGDLLDFDGTGWEIQFLCIIFESFFTFYFTYRCQYTKKSQHKQKVHYLKEKNLFFFFFKFRVI